MQRSRSDKGGGETGGGAFTLEYIFEFDVLGSGGGCAYRGHSVSTDKAVYCARQPLRVAWTVPQDTDHVARQRAVVSVFESDMYADLTSRDNGGGGGGGGGGAGGAAAGLMCMEACAQAGACASCYERVCKPNARVSCPSSLTLRELHGQGGGGGGGVARAGLMLPNTPAMYRACYFKELDSFPHAPLVCSDPFRLSPFPVDACGVCEGVFFLS
jgi:hypothetical protein